MKEVRVGNIAIGDSGQLVLIAGPCVIESETSALKMAEEIRRITEKLDIPFIYKSSYLKDNRSSIKSYQGPGLEKGLKILSKVKSEIGVPVLSDVHSVEQVKPASEVLDVLQIPAYLSMQTQLALEVGRYARAVNIKKGQFLDPGDIENTIGKIESVGNHNIMLTERGTCFGYHNLVVDFRSLPVMRALGYPVIFDVTHSVRVYGISSSDPEGGRPEFVPFLARAGVAAGCEAVFIETHHDVSRALCDASSMWPLQKLENLIKQLKEIHEIVRKYKRI
ncbi:MAG: 3-deoxy-8-phosphooctulonate synthase [Fidelibacterota bacterium]